MRENWQCTILEYLIEFSQIGIVRNNKNQSNKYPYRYFKMNNIKNNNGIDESSFSYIKANSDEIDKYSLINGDFLFNTRNSFELVGKSCIYSSSYPKPVLFNNNILRLRFKKKISPHFIAYAFCNTRIKEQLEKIKSGTTSVVGIYYKSLKNIKISIPRIDEQKRIVKKIDESFDKIDKAIANTKKNIENAKELFRSKLNEILVNSVNGCEILPFEKVCEISGGSQPPKRYFIYKPKEGYIRLIQVRDYKTDKFITYIPKEKAKKLCSSEDIMIGRYGPPIFGIFEGLEGAYNVALMKAIPNEKKVNKEYLRWFLKSNDLVKFVEKSSKRAAGQDGVRKERLYSYPVPVPPMEEQKEKVKTLDDLSDHTKKLESTYNQKLLDLEDLKKSILDKAFKGEL